MSRETVLALLRLEEGEFVSGEHLSRRLGLSRAAVWKAVDALRRDGYNIEARTGLGYRLMAAPDVLTEEEIRSLLGKTETVGRKLCCFSRIGSTNTYAKGIAFTDAPDGTVVIANSQTAGRGRLNRSFLSPPDQGIYLSVLLRPDLPPERLTPVTAMAGVAVCDAVERVCGVRPQLKWPNDPILNNKKLCGILTEVSVEAESGHVQCLVLGIGLNVLQGPGDFPSELGDIATSLSMALHRNISRPALAAAEIEALDRLYADLRAGDLSRYLEIYRRDCVNLGKTVQLSGADGSREIATAEGIDDTFGLIVRDQAGRSRIIRSGEVSVRGMYGYV